MREQFKIKGGFSFCVIVQCHLISHVLAGNVNNALLSIFCIMLLLKIIWNENESISY